MGATLLATTLLVSQHPDPADAWKWKLYATAMVIFALVSWYEIVFVFPINDEVKAIGGKLEKAGDEQLSEPEQKRLAGLLTQWEKRHRVRIAIPLAGLVLSIAAILL